MRFQTCPRRQTVQNVISAHRKTRLVRLFIQNNSYLLFYFLLYPANILVALHEARVFRRLITVDPITTEEARKKFLYLAALLAAKSIDPRTQEMEAAIRTLRPFKGELATTMSRNSKASIHTS
jgi:hypothetical protein